MTTRRIVLVHNEETSTGDVHILPCQIRHHGPAPVSQFFKPERVAREGSGNGIEGVDQVAYFRGRKMLGTTMALPQGYTGRIYEPSPAQTVSIKEDRHLPRRHRDDVKEGVSEDDEDEDDDDAAEAEEMEEQSVWTAKHTFRDITEYGNNTVAENKLLEWLALSKVIHGQDT